MTEEELAKADQRERTQARKLGLMSPATAARARARATGSAHDAAAAVAALEAELHGLTGAERRKQKKRLRKKVRGVIAAPDHRLVEDAAALLAPAIDVAANFVLLDAESGKENATSVTDTARVLNAAGCPFSLHAEEPSAAAVESPLAAAAAEASTERVAVPTAATVPVLLLASQAYLVSRLCAFASPVTAAAAPSADAVAGASGGDASSGPQLRWTLPVYSRSGGFASPPASAVVPGPASVGAPLPPPVPTPPTAPVAATAASKKASKRARQRANKKAAAASAASRDDSDNDTIDPVPPPISSTPALPPPVTPADVRTVLGSVDLRPFPGVPTGLLPQQLWRAFAASFTPSTGARAPLSAHGDLCVWQALLPAAALVEAIERVEAELPQVAFLVTYGVCSHVPGDAFSVSAAAASPTADGPLHAPSNGAAAWLRDRTIHSLGADVAGNLRPLVSLVGVQIAGPQVPADLAAALKGGCTGAFAAARCALTAAESPGASSGKAVASDAASDGSDAEDDSRAGSTDAVTNLVVAQCPQFIGPSGRGSSAALLRPFVDPEQLRRLAQNSFSGGTFKLRPVADRLAPWFTPPPRPGELIALPGAAPSVRLAATALGKVATHLQVRR